MWIFSLKYFQCFNHSIFAEINLSDIIIRQKRIRATIKTKIDLVTLGFDLLLYIDTIHHYPVKINSFSLKTNSSWSMGRMFYTYIMSYDIILCYWIQNTGANQFAKKEKNPLYFKVKKTIMYLFFCVVIIILQIPPNNNKFLWSQRTLY